MKVKIKKVAKKQKKKIVPAKRGILVKTVPELQKDPPSGVAGIIHQVIAGNKLDGAIAWLSTKAGKKYIKNLLLAAPMMSTKITKTDKYLVITGLKRLFFWQLESLSGDTYIRNHPADKYTKEDVSVRGSLKLLKGVFGAENVQIVNQSAVLKLRGTLKSDVSCLKAA